jgi:proteasome lid subunit RPN8/RPN11
MATYLTEDFKIKIAEHANQEAPNECCGLLVQTPDGVILIKCQNVSNTPKNHFIIRNTERQQAEEKGKILAFYHSHVNSPLTLSEVDKVVSEELQINCILYVVGENKFEEYVPQGYEVPYENRPFLLGVLDCIVLVRDYYKREFNIELAPFFHPVRDIPDNWKETEFNFEGYNALFEYFKNNGFEEVKDLKKNDVILSRLALIKCPVHCAVYLGDSKVLHHPPGISKIESYSDAHKRATVHIMRHPLL